MIQMSRRHTAHPSSCSGQGAPEIVTTARGVRSTHGQYSESQVQDKHSVCLYLAVYNQNFGNMYHWALAAQVASGQDVGWHIFEVIQQKTGENRPAFIPTYHRASPTQAVNCLRPLQKLITVDARQWGLVREQIRLVRVAGKGTSWNCQEYVLDIWEQLFHSRVINYTAWSVGKDLMMDRYGPQERCTTDDELEGAGTTYLNE